MYELTPPSRPAPKATETRTARAAPSEQRSLVSDVVAAAPGVKRYRAIITRSIQQTAFVEFDASEASDRWLLAKDLAVQIPADAWSEGTPSDPWIQELEIAPDA